MTQRLHAREALSGLAPDDTPPIDLRGADPELVMRAARWSSMVPSRFALADLDAVAATEGVGVADQLHGWAVGPPANLVIFGDRGVGKTLAAFAAARLLVDRRVELLFLPSVEMLDALRPGGPEGVIEQLYDVDMLFLDDLGSERTTDWTTERIYAVINRRWLEELRTIVTANGAPQDLADAIGPRSYSRLVGSGATLISMHGPDRRLT